MVNENSTQDPNTKKSLWGTILQVITSPVDFLQHWSKKSPLLTVIAVVFLLQPVISTSIDVIDEWRTVKENLNPGKRPVTKDELDIVNQKIDFLQQLLVTQVQQRHSKVVIHKDVENSNIKQPTSAPAALPPGSNQELQNLQTKLASVEKQADADWVKSNKVKK